MARVRVPLYGTTGYVTIETNPTLGATLGVDLYFDGRLLDPRLILNSYAGGNTFVSSGSSGGGTRPPVGGGPRSTDELDEGRYNWYFTVERAQDAVGAALIPSSNVTLTYDDGANTIIADLTTTGVTPDTYGDATHFPVITVDQWGRITGVTLQVVSGGGSVAWGAITGTLSDQTDLQLELDALQLELDERRSAAKRGALVATAAALPACAYANGTAGVGATLTATSNGALTVDGVLMGTGGVVLVKDEAADETNGLYVVTATGDAGTPFVLTRDVGMDESEEILAALIPVGPEGTANPGTIWRCTTPAGPVMGTTPITFVAVAGGGVTYTDTGIMFANGSLDAAASAVGTAIADELRAMSVGAYSYATKDWNLWVYPVPTTGLFELDVFLRGFGNTSPDTGDSICDSDYPSLSGNGTDFTATGDTTGWAGVTISVGDMLVVRPRTNTAGVTHWVFFIGARRTF